jgi:hypothetical protein
MTSGIAKEEGLDRLMMEEVKTMIETALARNRDVET